ncbi:MAG: hypothetical protein EAZ55_09030 [Cytophagales bacterium]|nr:MAG: hypothetical protein EAZ55_09030 [Cytophagales bacterium]
MTTQNLLDRIYHFVPQKYESDNVKVLYELKQDLLASDNPEQFIIPLFELIEKYPTMEAGTPFPVVHFLEKQDYEVALLDSLARKPTPMTVFMLNRILNVTDENSSKYENLLALMKTIADNPDVEEISQKEARDFYAYQMSKEN